jgi:diguanylate cyclase (GGDEF)-like protein
VGDEILTAFASRASACIRESSDWMARYGGEEFTLVLPHTSLDGAHCVAEKIRADCAESAFNTTAGPLSLTVSLGIAALQPAVDVKSATSDLLHRADVALYRSKHEGRNRVTRTCD